MRSEPTIVIPFVRESASVSMFESSNSRRPLLPFEVAPAPAPTPTPIGSNDGIKNMTGVIMPAASLDAVSVDVYCMVVFAWIVEIALNPLAGLWTDTITTAAASNEVVTAVAAVTDEIEAAVVGLAVGAAVGAAEGAAVGAAVGAAEGAAVGTAVGAAVGMLPQMWPLETTAARLTPSLDMAMPCQFLVGPGLKVFSVQVAPLSLELHMLP